LKLRDIADRLACRIEGDEEIESRRVAGIELAQKGDLTFVANPKYRRLLPATCASAVILGTSPGVEAPAGCAVLRTAEPYLTFARALSLFAAIVPPAPGVDRLSAVAADATLGADVSIGPFVTIGPGASIGPRTIIHANAVVGPGACIGEDCVIHSHVSIREGVVLGRRVVVQDGAVVGSDGFGFARQSDGTYLKIPQHAGVVLEDDVEIGANTTIDRPAVGETRIQAGTKIDNLVQIAHGVRVGRSVLLAAQVGIAGSSVIDDEVVLAGQVGVAGHLHVGKGVVATAQTGIPCSVEPGERISGYPAIPNREWLKSSAVFRQLPALKRRLADLDDRVAELEGKLADRRLSPNR
jgi:UDP-3-O-[3-hydroxymyristoyl] glucosamine N-acyltransferase